MARNIISRCNFVLNQFEHAIRNIFGGNFPPAPLCVVDTNHYDYWPKITQNSSRLTSLKDIIGEGFLWAVPKTRRPIEKRLNRRFAPNHHIWRMVKPKKHLAVCSACGHDYERGLLCHHCYVRVRTETEEMQKTIVDNLGLKPVEEEVVVLYEGEKASAPKDYWKGQRVVELPKQRPAWFHSNLLQPTTQEPAESADVKPTDLA